MSSNKAKPPMNPFVEEFLQQCQPADELDCWIGKVGWTIFSIFVICLVVFA